MERYTITTLVDITRSNCHRSEIDKVKIGQQANFNSLRQSIELRSNIVWDNDPKFNSGALPMELDGKANYWTWEFSAEREDVFKKGDDPVGLLVDDLHGVPIIDQLHNSVDLTPSIFNTKGTAANTWISKLTAM